MLLISCLRSGRRRVLKAAGLAVVMLLMLMPVAIAIHAGIYDSFIDNSLSGWGMWGAFTIYVATRPPRQELALTAALALALRLAFDLAVGEHGYTGSLVLAMGPFLVLASLAPLSRRACGPPGEQRALCRQALGIIALLSYIGVCLNFYISFARMVLPRKLDYFLYNFDGSLGFQPSFAAGRLMRAAGPLQSFEAMVYDSLGFWFAHAYAVHAGHQLPYRISFPKLFIGNAFIGFSLYFLFPAMGPKHAFPGFPAAPGAAPPTAALLSGIPNAMPSLHFAGALLICWLAKPWKWLHRIGIAFVALTALATLGLGEHYLIDLVVAVPYAAAIFAFAAQTPGRRLPMAISWAMVLCWLLYLRAGWYFAPLSWALALGTVWAALSIERRLPVWGGNAATVSGFSRPAAF